jgi:hypothetical protein
MVPEGTSLCDQRREDERAHAYDRADDDKVQDENREPARHPPADWQHLLALDQPHDRTEADGEDAADVEQQQNIAHQINGVEQHDAAERHRNGPGD